MAQHVAPFDHLGDNAVDQEFGRDPLGIKQADHPVGIPHRGDLGGADDQRFVGGGDGVLEAAFDAGRTVDENEVEFPAELLSEADHFLGIDHVFVVALGRGNEKQALDPPVPDGCLLQLAFSLDRVHDVEHDPVFQSHDHVQVPQADVHVHDRDPFAVHGEGRAQGCGGGGFPHAAFARRDYDDSPVQFDLV